MMIVFEVTTEYFRLLPWAERRLLGGKRSLAVGWGFLVFRVYRHNMHDFGALLKRDAVTWKE